jgi:hypothetical protein
VLPVIGSARSIDPVVPDVGATFMPLFARHPITHVVFPHSVDLEVPLSDTLVADAKLLYDTAAAVVARHDTYLNTVQPELLERELHDQRNAFDGVRLPGVILIDPIPDGARLHGPANDVVEVDLASDPLADKQTELKRCSRYTVTVSLKATGRECRLIGGGVGLMFKSARFPHREPLVVALTDFTPRSKIVGRKWPHHQPPSVELDRGGRARGVPECHD